MSKVRTVCSTNSRHGQVAELAGDLARIQQETEISGRDASGNSGRLLLHIVGDKPVVLFSAERGIVAPDVQGNAAQEMSVARADFLVQRTRRPV